MSRGGPERSPAVQLNCESLSMFKTVGERLCRLRLTFFSAIAGEAGEREGECGSKRAVRDCALAEVGWTLLFKVLINTFDCCSLSKPVRGSASDALSWVFWLASWALAAAERRLLAGKELLMWPFCWLFCWLRICPSGRPSSPGAWAELTPFLLSPCTNDRACDIWWLLWLAPELVLQSL